MSLAVLRHALAQRFLTQLRDETTPPESFRAVTRVLTQILVAEATRELPIKPVSVRTPLEDTGGAELSEPVVVVPVLRAGLGMLEPALEFLPQAGVGYVGLERDEVTAVASAYYCKLPPTRGATVLVLDPMLATGGSAAWALERIFAEGAGRALLLCIVAAPEGVQRLEAAFPALRIVAAAVDRELNSRKFIVPGLGDFGDRLYGTV